jgi:uncharacterized membrane protein
MAPTIELPGEAHPLTHRNVVDALVLAASSTQQQVQTGTKQLENWERHALYHTMLQVCWTIFDANTSCFRTDACNF